jgi:hypothetical protein
VGNSIRVETVATLASRLEMARDAVVSEVVEGRLSYVNVGGHWRSREVDIDCWRKNPGATFSEETDVQHTDVYFKVDRFENHLQQNNPLEEGNGDPSFRYKNPIDNPQRWAAGAFFSWCGPYFDEFTTDAWGNRYSANVFALHREKDADEGRGLFTSAVVCLSAGPDGAVDATFNQPMNDNETVAPVWTNAASGAGSPSTRQIGTTTQTYEFSGGQASAGAVNAYSTGVSYNTGG